MYQYTHSLSIMYCRGMNHSYIVHVGFLFKTKWKWLQCEVLFSLPALSALTVQVTGSGSATVGSSYTLTCTVTLPTGVAVTPDVQWAGPGLSGDTTWTVTGSGGTYTSELPLNPLSPSHGGDYTCTATYTVGGQTSLERRGTITVTVMSE